ncbi:MAG: GMC family oxidoreductase N-terminal domain-containing protein [Myxococcota bacterium]
MIYGQKATPEDLDVRADVCIVGSGAGGSVIAREMAGKGLKVVVLEEGGYYTSKDFTQLEREMIPLLYKEKGNQATADLAVTVFQGRCVGGTTVVNYLCSFRTPDRVLREWEERGVAGMSPAQMKPHIDSVWETLSVERMPESMLNRNNKLLKIGGDALGWRGGTFWRNQIGCWGAGFCGVGCSYDAKQSALLAFLHQAVNDGADVYAGCRVDRILTEGDRAVGVEGVTMDPETDAPRGKLTVRADVVVLACGSINTPEVLLRSNIGGPMVGKNLHLHPAIPVNALFEEDVHNYYGVKQGYYIDEFSDVFHDDLESGYLIEGVGSQAGLGSAALPDQGKWHRDRMKNFKKLTLGGVLVRDRDDSGSVSIDGNGRRKIEYTATEAQQQLWKHGLKRTAEAYLAAGAKEVYPGLLRPITIRSKKDLALIDEAPAGPGEVLVFSMHQMGSARMGEDPKSSVVNSNGRVHTTKNLMVADASAFPTPSGVNPQITVYTVAHHHAKFLSGNWDDVASGKA